MNMLLPKQNRIRDRKWLDEVKKRPCLLTGEVTTEYMGIDPHHLMTGRYSSGMKSADNRVIPLRHDLHAKIGTKEYPTELDLVRDYLSDHLLAELLKAWAERQYWEYLNGEN